MDALQVEPRKDRDDGRFYIPIKNCRNGKIVARVASDAFDGDENRATSFAMALVEAFNGWSIE